MRIEKLSAGLAKMESYRLIRSVRAGLTIAIPILMIGSFSLLIRTFAGYFPALIFIEELAELLYQCTFGILSVLLTGCGLGCAADRRKTAARGLDCTAGGDYGVSHSYRRT